MCTLKMNQQSFVSVPDDLIDKIVFSRNLICRNSIDKIECIVSSKSFDLNAVTEKTVVTLLNRRDLIRYLNWMTYKYDEINGGGSEPFTRKGCLEICPL
jgi:hypothetical protein